MQVSTLLVVPICPHTCEHVWRNILRKKGSALIAGFPAGAEPDFGIRSASAPLAPKTSIFLSTDNCNHFLGKG